MIKDGRRPADWVLVSVADPAGAGCCRAVGEGAIEARKAVAAEDLAVVIAVLHERGLLDAGFKVARDADIWGIVWHDPGSSYWDPGTRDRLAEARHVLLAALDPLLLPATLIVLGRAAIALLGGASVGEIYPDPVRGELR